MRVARLHLAVGLAAVAASGGAPPAEAGWSAPQTLARPAAEHLATAGNPRGTEAFAWQVTTKRFVRTPTWRGYAGYVRARIRLADGRLGRSQVVSATSEIVADPQVALDRRGNAIVVWTQAGRHIRVMGAYRPHGERFGRPFEIGRTGALHGARPLLAVTRDGAVVAWSGGSDLRLASRPAGRCRRGVPRGCFGVAQRFAGGADHAIAASARGRVYVAWVATVREGEDAHTRLRLAVMPRGGRFGHSRAVTTGGDASQPSLAVAGDSPILAWRASPPAGGEQNEDATILVAAAAADGRILLRQAISTLPGSNPEVRASAGPDAYVVWDQRKSTPQNPDGPEIAGAPLASDGTSVTFGAAALLSPPGVPAGSASLTIDAGGALTVAFSAALTGDDGPVGVVRRGMLRAGAAAPDLGAPEQLPADFSGAVVLAAGARVTVVSGGSGGRTLLSDYAP